MPNLCLISSRHYTSQRFRAFALCVLLAATPACARPGETDYVPLVAGAHRDYAGRISSPNGQFDVPVTIRVEGDTIIRARRYFKYVIWSDMSALTNSPRQTEEIRYYRATHDGIYFLRGTVTSGDELPEMPRPIPIGVAWLSGMSEVRAERAGTVQSGGHEYAHCLKVTYKGMSSGQHVENYPAPSVGLVRAVFADVAGPGSSPELTLVRYEQ